MERGSDKHGPLRDDELKHETESIVRGRGESRAEEWHQVEPAGEDQPGIDPDVNPRGAPPPGMTVAEVEHRAELAGYIESAPYPAVREQIIETAIGRQAPDRVVDFVRGLPSGRTFANVGDVWSALGGHREDHRF